MSILVLIQYACQCINSKNLEGSRSEKLDDGVAHAIFPRDLDT
jgi:hypothetical protein